MPPSILIVDDEPLMADILTAALKLNSYEVEEHTDPVKAFKSIETRKFRLIVTDIMMPDMDGFELIDKTRASKSNKDTPILVITAKFLTVDEKRRLFDARCIHIRKPFVPRQLVEQVKKILQDENQRSPAVS